MQIDPQPLQFPLRGSWFVSSGGRNAALNHHWGLPDQQFAVDVVKHDGRSTHTGDRTKLEHYGAFDRPVYAAAAGVVVRAFDELPDNPIDTTDEVHVDGNHVMLRLADGTFLLYDHLHSGSVAVGVGDAVRAGTLLGRIGNSGNSSEPHLHLQLQTNDSLDPAVAVSIPMRFGPFMANEARIDSGELPGMSFVRRAPAS